MVAHLWLSKQKKINGQIIKKIENRRSKTLKTSLLQSRYNLQSDDDYTTCGVKAWHNVKQYLTEGRVLFDKNYDI